MEKSKYLSPMFMLTPETDPEIEDPWSQGDLPYDGENGVEFDDVDGN